MSALDVLKFVHLLLAIVAVGANVTYGLWISRAAKDARHLVFTLQGIKAIDGRLVTPGYVLLLLTGLGLLHFSRLRWATPWIVTSLVLYGVVAVLAMAGFTPVLRRQIEALDARGPDSLEYRVLASRAQLIGMVLAALVIVIVFLMVAKPVLWS